jgi:triacylglycerol lipase
MDIKRALAVGDFVQRAYKAFDLLPDKTNLTPAIALPDGFDLVARITMEDFLFKTGDPRERRFYGFLAHELNTDHYIFALRGTDGPLEWWDNLHGFTVPFREVANCGRVGYGFESIYGTAEIAYVDAAMFSQAASLAPDDPGERCFAEHVGMMIRVHHAEHHNRRTVAPEDRITPNAIDLTQMEISVAGHSLGAALATLFVMENDTAPKAQMRPRSMHTFASPMVGDATFARRFNDLKVETWRIYNAPDIVPMQPLNVEGYVHVGRPFRIDTRQMDDIKWTLPCWHVMESYLAALGDSQYLEKCRFNDLHGLEGELLREGREFARRALGLPAHGRPDGLPPDATALPATPRIATKRTAKNWKALDVVAAVLSAVVVLAAVVIRLQHVRAGTKAKSPAGARVGEAPNSEVPLVTA